MRKRNGWLAWAGLAALLAGAASAAAAEPRRVQVGASAAALAASPADVAPTSDEPLREESLRGPAGGVRLPLRGRHGTVIGRDAAAPGARPHSCAQPAAAGHE